jgi:hypothetical protein
MFFENIIPMFPIFHRPTFVFRDCAPPLLLNAIALGARFLGSQDAIAKVALPYLTQGRGEMLT